MTDRAATGPDPLTCPECGGTGLISERHPMWGSIFCPEPWVERECSTCSWLVEVEAEADRFDPARKAVAS